MFAVTVVCRSSGRVPVVYFGMMLAALWPGGLVANDPPETPARQRADDEVLFSRTLEGGLLFLDGVTVNDQLTIVATRDSMTVNNLPFPWQAFDEDGFSEFSSKDQDEAAEYRHSANARGRRKGLRLPSVHAARNLADMLESGTLVVAFQGLPMRGIYGVTEELALFQALLADTPSPQQLQDFLDLPVTAAEKATWHEWLDSFQPDGRLRAFMEARVESIQRNEMESLAQSEALIRLDKFSYPLTLIAMILGVFAMGHMLRWTGRSMVTDQGDNCSPESVRCAEVALLLMLGMSAIDLIWTILAGQAGIMKETNPLAAGLIHSPASLAVFKVTATLIGCGILFAIRSRRHGQTATWWMCLVCVLVTFRWVMFDSMTAS